jgi:hypothetical protein
MVVPQEVMVLQEIQVALAEMVHLVEQVALAVLAEMELMEQLVAPVEQVALAVLVEQVVPAAAVVSRFRLTQSLVLSQL